MKFIYCLKTSKQEIITIFSTFLTGVSLLGMKWDELNFIKKIFIIIALSIAAVLILYSFFRIFWGKHIYKLEKDEDKINQYMHEIYLRTGSLVICTSGQLDWVTDEIKAELKDKAQSKHLIIFSSTKNSFLNELEKEGAIIYDKKMLGVAPCSNTSIINGGVGNVFIATGLSDNKYHIIEEYTAKCSATNVITDLMTINEKLINQNIKLKLLQNKQK